MNHLPQILYLILTAIGLLVAANKHGKTKTETGNFWISAVASAIILSLLIWGGFFKGMF